MINEQESARAVGGVGLYKDAIIHVSPVKDDTL